MKRKLLTGLLGIVLLSLCNAVAEAQIVYKAYEINEDFESLTVGDTWGFENQIQPAVSDAPIAPHTGNVLQWSFINQSGSRTGYKDFTAIAIPEDGILKLDFDWHLGVPTNKNTSGVFFRFKDAAGNISIAFSTASNNGGSGNALHYVNLDNGVTNDATAASTLIAPTGGNFARDSWVSIHASLNFNTKIVDTLIVTNGTATYTNYGTTFYSDQASTISRFEVYLQRDGQNGGWTGQIDNFQIYRYEEVAGTADVTVKFKDQDDNEFKTEEIISDLAIGVTYNATIAQKASVKDVDDYYTLDPSSLTSVEVAAGGSTLTLQFRKAPYFSAVTWNGTAEANTWNEWDTFFLNETTETAYQKDAQVTFDATAAEKTVLVNEAIDLGAGNITISGSGYSFTGSGQLVGTGAININLSGEDAISLGVTNSLTGATQIAGGTVTLAKNGVLGTGIVVNGGATFVPSVNDIAFPAATFNANAAIQVGNLRTSISDITIPEGVKVSVSSAYNTNNDFAFGFAATGTIASGAELELNGT
ncbi:MAG: hypothetical protein LBM08_06115, partial [Dysgonamonadaceae bacterium]|nr:hypothetical protein [Dysgonamonadaceae bacterium]